MRRLTLLLVVLMVALVASAQVYNPPYPGVTAPASGVLNGAGYPAASHDLAIVDYGSVLEESFKVNPGLVDANWCTTGSLEQPFMLDAGGNIQSGATFYWDWQHGPDNDLTATLCRHNGDGAAGSFVDGWRLSVTGGCFGDTPCSIAQGTSPLRIMLDAEVFAAPSTTPKIYEVYFRVGGSAGNLTNIKTSFAASIVNVTTSGDDALSGARTWYELGVLHEDAVSDDDAIGVYATCNPSTCVWAGFTRKEGTGSGVTDVTFSPVQTVVHDAMVRAKFVYTSSRVDFYMNGVLVGSSTTHLPTTELSPTFSIAPLAANSTNYGYIHMHKIRYYPWP